MNFSIKKIACGVLLFLIIIAIYFICNMIDCRRYLYPTLSARQIIIDLSAIIIIYGTAVFLVGLVLKKGKWIEKVCVIIVSAIILMAFLMMLFLTRTINSSCSRTYDFDNYLIIDENCKADYSFFPHLESLENYNVEYFYYYEEEDHDNLYEIKLSIHLRDDEVHEYVKRIEEIYGTFDNYGEITLQEYVTAVDHNSCYCKIIHKGNNIIYLSFCGKQ